ncbi:hypothetical protein VTN96DRAFT_1089 [Rasamsonia emersonii]
MPTTFLSTLNFSRRKKIQLSVLLGLGLMYVFFSPTKRRRRKASLTVSRAAICGIVKTTTLDSISNDDFTCTCFLLFPATSRRTNDVKTRERVRPHRLEYIRSPGHHCLRKCADHEASLGSLHPEAQEQHAGWLLPDAPDVSWASAIVVEPGSPGTVGRPPHMGDHRHRRGDFRTVQEPLFCRTQCIAVPPPMHVTASRQRRRVWWLHKRRALSRYKSISR